MTDMAKKNWSVQELGFNRNDGVLNLMPLVYYQSRE